MRSQGEVTKVDKRLRKAMGTLQRIHFLCNDVALAAQSAWADFQEAADWQKSDVRGSPSQILESYAKTSFIDTKQVL